MLPHGLNFGTILRCVWGHRLAFFCSLLALLLALSLRALLLALLLACLLALLLFFLEVWLITLKGSILEVEN